jgi:transposase-like protein
VAEQRYQAVLAVISDGLSISQVAEKVGVSRQTLHSWLARYEAQGLEGLVDRSHRPVSCPHQMPAVVEAALLELRRSRPYWGPRRLVFELAKRRVTPVPSPVGGLPGAGACGHDRPNSAGSAFTQVETLGTRRADGVVADGHRGRLPAGRWHLSESLDRHRRPLSDVRGRTVDGPRTHPRGLRRATRGAERLRSARTDTHRHSICVSGAELVLSAGGEGSVPSGTRPLSLLDRLERPATSCLLIMLAGGATAGS